MMASVLATFAQFERRLIGQRTRDALAVKRAQGVQLGRPREISEQVVERIRESPCHRAQQLPRSHANSTRRTSPPHAADGGIPPASNGRSHGFAREERSLRERQGVGLSRAQARNEKGAPGGALLSTEISTLTTLRLRWRRTRCGRCRTRPGGGRLRERLPVGLLPPVLHASHDPSRRRLSIILP